MEPTPPVDRPANTGGRLARIAGIAAVPALVGAFIGAGGIDLIVPQDPYVQIAEDAGQEMIQLPGFEERFGELDEDEAFDAGAEIGLAAIPRLSEDELTEWLAITRELVGSLDVASCAMVARGTASDSDEWLEVFKSLDADTFERYAKLIVGGARLELASAPPPPAPSQQEVDAAIVGVVEEIGAARFDEIGRVLTSSATASDAEVCSAMRDLYAGLSGLDAHARATLIRMFMGTTPAA